MRRHLLLIFIVFALLPATEGAAARIRWNATNYGTIKDLMQKIAEKHPKSATVVTIGDSDSGDKILGLKIGNGSVKTLVVATHHGNEYGSSAVGIHLAASLAETPIADRTVFVIPVLNIAGYDARQRREPASGRTFDPNRDYPGPCGTEGPFRLKSTASLAKFVEANDIVTSATLHTFYPSVTYPWGLTTGDTQTQYDELFTKLGAAATAESKYRVGNTSQVIYPALGTFEDYAFWKHGIWSMLFELGYSHSPTQAQIDEMVRVNVPGLRRMLAAAPKARAPDHIFKGRCDRRVRQLDRHDE